MIQECHCGMEGCEEMVCESESVILLRSISERLTRLETKIEIYFGEDGTIPEMKKKVDGMHGKILMFSGAGAVLIFLADWVKAAIFNK